LWIQNRTAKPHSQEWLCHSRRTATEKARKMGVFSCLTGAVQYTNMNSGSYMKRAFLIGFLLWMVGTILLRFGGRGILRAGRPVHTVVLYLVSFLLMAVIIPGICRRLKFTGDSRFQGAALLILPTLLLDPFSSAFFATVFPNLDPAGAGVFGGWILICCAGAVVGVWLSK
jgi:Family of unknown function (DUF5367)